MAPSFKRCDYWVVKIEGSTFFVYNDNDETTSPVYFCCHLREDGQLGSFVKVFQSARSGNSSYSRFYKREELEDGKAQILFDGEYDKDNPIGKLPKEFDGIHAIVEDCQKRIFVGAIEGGKVFPSLLKSELELAAVRERMKK